MEHQETLDVLIAGAGVVGLAIARALAEQGREVVVLESEPSFGRHSSSRNSEVIHAGIYYPKGSLKALLCARGRDALYSYCATSGVRCDRVGKVIVATNEREGAALAEIRQLASSNGVTLAELDGKDVERLEPNVTAVRGLFSQATGIVDSHGLMQALLGDAECKGARLVLSTPVLSGSVERDGFTVRIGGPEPGAVRCRAFVNAAGLGAQALAQSISGIPASTIPERHFAKGHYFTLRGPSPFGHLVYPVPSPDGLGVHVTLDLDGQARFGPDVSWVDAVDYAFDESRAKAFYAAIRRYYPALPDGALVPGYTGIRPKLAPRGSPASDFVIQGAAEHGVRHLVSLYGIESPGLTASLAIAELVSALV